MLLDTGDEWTVNGMPIDCPGWWRNPDKGGKGLAMSPPRRDTSIPVPGRRGAIPGPVEYDAGTLVFNLCVLGVDPATGQVPSWSTTEEQLERNLGQLQATFHTPVLDVRRRRYNSSVRRTDGVLDHDQALDPEIAANTYPAYAELGVPITINESFWVDAEPVTAQLEELVSGEVRELWEFDGADAPLDDLVYTLGPAWNPVVADAGSSGTWWAYDAVILPGQAIVYDAGAREVYGAGGLLLDQGLIRRGRWLTLAAGSPPALTVTHDGPDPVSLLVSGRRGYLTA